MPAIDLRRAWRLLFKKFLRELKYLPHMKYSLKLYLFERECHSILDIINKNETIKFIDCFTYQEGRMGAIVTFLAILELAKEGLIDIVQNQDYSMIYLQSVIL